jgi:hypothetical protein
VTADVRKSGVPLLVERGSHVPADFHINVIFF